MARLLVVTLLVLASMIAATANAQGNGNSSNGSYTLNGTSLAVSNAVLPQYGMDISPLKLVVDQTRHYHLNVKIDDANASVPRWQVPKDLLKSELVMADPNATKLYELKTVNSPFGFSVGRAAGNGYSARTIFDTTGLPLVFKDQYIELNARLDPTSSLFGLGEQTRQTGMRIPRDGIRGIGKPFTLWARDQGSLVNATNLYSSWPVLFQVHEDGTTDAVLLLNSNGMDIFIDGDIITFKTIGGIIDLHFFMGPTPTDVMNQYTAFVGRPAVPPYWSLGFHQCKWGYNNIYEWRGVIANYSAANIPLETMWADIDYMDHFRDFTLNPTYWPYNLTKQTIDELHARGQHAITIVDPGISAWTGDTANVEGLRDDVFIKDYLGLPFLGQVWPGVVHFPDFLNPKTQAWWTRQFADFYGNHLPVDGIWIDMNEPANFCNGDLCGLPVGASLDNLTTLVNADGVPNYICDVLICTSDPYQLVRFPTNLTSLIQPPYMIDNTNWQHLPGPPPPLNTKTTGMTNLHYGNVTEYNAKNLYGLSMAKMTQQSVMDVIPGRPFVLSRSTFPGAGAYTAHWTGDNAATWDDLRWSISTCLTTGLVGMPMIGADVCGFNGNTTEQLCNRWMSAGAFYPFYRNHNNDGTGVLINNVPQNGSTVEQEAYRWESVAAASRTAIAKRYELLTYMYTGLGESNLYGCPLMRPLWYSWPADKVAQSIDLQWLLGDGVLVSPVLQENATNVTAYVPQGIWYDLWNMNNTVDRRSGGANATFESGLDGEVPLHVRGGTILPLQQAAMVTKDVRASDLQVLVALPQAESSNTGSSMGRKLFQQAGNTASSPAALTCGKPATCGVATATSATACGHVMFDAGGNTRFLNGQDLKDHMASMSADIKYANGTSTGSIYINFSADKFFASNASGGSATCPKTLDFPKLGSVTVLGLNQQTAPNTVTVRAGNGASTTVSAEFDAAAKKLVINNLGRNLSCPDNVVISW